VEGSIPLFQALSLQKVKTRQSQADRPAATAPPTLEGGPKETGPPSGTARVGRAAFIGCHARLSEVLTKDATGLPWHFRYSRAENTHGRRRALDLVQAHAGASRLPAVAGARRGDRSRGEEARADQQQTMAWVG
jgi:hypothetical protein